MFRETDPKSAALSDRTLKADFTVHHFGQALCDCKADSGAFYQESIRFNPIKRFENIIVKFCWNPTSCVAHIYADDAVLGFASDFDSSIGGVVFDGVAYQIEQYLLESNLIGQD